MGIVLFSLCDNSRGYQMDFRYICLIGIVYIPTSKLLLLLKSFEPCHITSYHIISHHNILYHIFILHSLCQSNIPTKSIKIVILIVPKVCPRIVPESGIGSRISWLIRGRHCGGIESLEFRHQCVYHFRIS